MVKCDLNCVPEAPRRGRRQRRRGGAAGGGRFPRETSRPPQEHRRLGPRGHPKAGAGRPGGGWEASQSSFSLFTVFESLFSLKAPISCLNNNNGDDDNVRFHLQGAYVTCKSQQSHPTICPSYLCFTGHMIEVF